MIMRGRLITELERERTGSGRKGVLTRRIGDIGGALAWEKWDA